MIRIIIDCYGGDNSPRANLEGGLNALKNPDMPDLELVFTGKEEEIKLFLKERNIYSERISVVNAPEVISPDEIPVDVIRFKKNSSLMAAVNLLRDDSSVSGMVSNGSTGALIAASVLRLGRLRNVIRPAFCPLLPTMNGHIVGVCDSGANVDITPEYIQQYAIMGSLYLQSVYDIKNPRVALLNIGVEAEKGDSLHKSAYELLSRTAGINFVGNMESRDLLTGSYDLVVCDGFSGNVLLKTTEGTAVELLKKLKQEIYSKVIYKIGGSLMKKLFVDFKELMNYQNYGGSVLLGTSKVVVKGHGSSNATAIEKCVFQAYSMSKNCFSEKVEQALEINSKL